MNALQALVEDGLAFRHKLPFPFPSRQKRNRPAPDFTRLLLTLLDLVLVLFLPLSEFFLLTLAHRRTLLDAQNLLDDPLRGLVAAFPAELLDALPGGITTLTLTLERGVQARALRRIHIDRFQKQLTVTKPALSELNPSPQLHQETA